MMVQKAVKSAPAELEVLLDDQTAVLNVTRFAEGQGYTVTVQEDGDEFRMELKK
jgi:TusA-related sulfurtransferase